MANKLPPVPDAISNQWGITHCVITALAFGFAKPDRTIPWEKEVRFLGALRTAFAFSLLFGLVGPGSEFLTRDLAALYCSLLGLDAASYGPRVQGFLNSLMVFMCVSSAAIELYLIKVVRIYSTEFAELVACAERLWARSGGLQPVGDAA